MTDEFDHDLYYTESASPKSINKLPEPVMPLLTPPNISRPVSKKTAPASSAKAADADVDDDDAIANLKSSLAKVASDKRENSYGSRDTFLQRAVMLTYNNIVLWFWEHCCHQRVKSSQAIDCWITPRHALYHQARYSAVFARLR